MVLSTPHPHRRAPLLAHASVAARTPFSRCGAAPVALLDLADAAAQVPDLASVSLDAIGRDLLIFLAAAVFVAPTAKALNTNPILLFLLLGAVLGPHGLNVFSNTEADVELGDFGVLFLLFAEGLEASPERLRSLSKFLSTAGAQMGLTAATFTAAILVVSSSGQLSWLSGTVE
eukprot:6711749-Prymnesium_polylepis.1